jgi:hypothetical protein
MTCSCSWEIESCTPPNVLRWALVGGGWPEITRRPNPRSGGDGACTQRPRGEAARAASGGCGGRQRARGAQVCEGTAGRGGDGGGVEWLGLKLHTAANRYDGWNQHVREVSDEPTMQKYECRSNHRKGSAPQWNDATNEPMSWFLDASEQLSKGLWKSEISFSTGWTAR